MVVLVFTTNAQLLSLRLTILEVVSLSPLAARRSENEGFESGSGFGRNRCCQRVGDFVGKLRWLLRELVQHEFRGHALVVYTLTARFNGPYDTVFSAFDLASEDPNALTGFWHKDNHGDPATNGILSQRYGTWDPTTTGSATANRPFDSYLTIGGIARPANTTRA